MKQKKWIAIILVLGFVLGLGACSASKPETSRETSTEVATTQAPTETESMAAPTEASFWAEEDLEYPMLFFFSSGAGGWATELYLEADGSFSGSFYDSDLGGGDGKYPNGMKYVCNFTGKFAPAERLDMYTYSMKLEELSMEHPVGEEWVADGILHIATTPYGLEDGEDFIIYLPNTPVEMLSEDAYMWWPNRFEEGASVLGGYGLYNLNGEYGFYCMKTD